MTPGQAAPADPHDFPAERAASEVAAFAAALRTENRNARSNLRRRMQQRALPQDPAPLRITGKVRIARNRNGSRGPGQRSGTDGQPTHE